MSCQLSGVLYLLLLLTACLFPRGSGPNCLVSSKQYIAKLYTMTTNVAARLSVWAKRTVTPLTFRQLELISKPFATTVLTPNDTLPPPFAKLFLKTQPEESTVEERVALVGTEMATRLAKATVAVQHFDCGIMDNLPGLTRTFDSYARLHSELDRLLIEKKTGGFHVADVKAMHDALSVIPNELGEDFKLLKTDCYNWFGNQLATHEEKIAALTPVLDHCYFFAISSRLLTSHYLIHHRKTQGQEEDPQYKAQLPYLLTKWKLAHLVRETAEDANVVMLGKMGNAPSVVVQGDEDLEALCCEPYLHFSLIEIIKNGMTAILEKNGRAFDVDFAPPLVISVESKGEMAEIKFSDQANGIQVDASKVIEYFHTTKPKLEGVQCREHGMSLPLVRQYARLHGGDLQIKSIAGKGTDVILTLKKEGGSDLAGGWQ